jgi:hypothetical protein
VIAIVAINTTTKAQSPDLRGRIIGPSDPSKFPLRHIARMP